MKPSIEISSLTISKLKNSQEDFIKYDIDLSLDEVENSDSGGVQLKYKFVLVSIPTNSRLSIEGLISLGGNESEISKQLEPDNKNIPMVVNMVYQEIYPLLYILTKSVQIPCPAYKLSQISPTPQSKINHETTNVQETAQSINGISSPNSNEIISEHLKAPNELSSKEIIMKANVK